MTEAPIHRDCPVCGFVSGPAVSHVHIGDTVATVATAAPQHWHTHPPGVTREECEWCQQIVGVPEPAPPWAVEMTRKLDRVLTLLRDGDGR